MKIKDYIQSGILEEYCLGLLSEDEQADVLKMCALFPEIQKELTSIENGIERVAIKRAITPSAEVKEKILNLLGFPGSIIKLEHHNLPLIDRWSNHRSWLDAVQHLIQPGPFSEKFYQVTLQQNKEVKQLLVIVENDIRQSVHENELESLFVLKGECKCVIDDKFFLLGPGDFIEVPANTVHQLKIITPSVIGILQYLPA